MKKTLQVVVFRQLEGMLFLTSVLILIVCTGIKQNAVAFNARNVESIGNTAAAVSPPFGSNLLTNPGFESSGAVGWNETVSTSVYRFDGTAPNEHVGGSQGRGYWWNTGADGVVNLQQTINNVAAGTYHVSIQSRSFSYGQAFLYKRLKIVDGSTTVATANLPYGDNFQQVTIDGIVVPQGANITFKVEFSLPNGNGYVNVDDAVFVGARPANTLYYVSTSGQDIPANGTQTNPYRTIAYAAQQVPAGQNNTIYVQSGTYIETKAIVLALGVNLKGAGKELVTVTSSGAIPSAPGVDANSAQYHLWYDGSLIQLASPIYSGSNPKYGPPAEMVPAQNGNQTISDLTLDGNNAKVKAGIWIENRNNVTVRDIDFKDFELHGAVASRGDMWWYEPLADGKWMRNTKIYNCSFTNCSGDNLGGSTSGVLALGGLDGANIYNITINENEGYGIKFKHVGHLRNVKIHDCTINVPEQDPTWGEDIAIELWNFSYNNEIYNIKCNTWLSLVNHAQLDEYYPTATHPSTVKVRNIRMIDKDGNSGKEAIEINNLSGVEISNSYFQDKGFYIAIWGGTINGGALDNFDINIHNNIFANVNRTVSFGFGNSSGIFVPDGANNITIHNNVFDNMGNSLQLSGSGFDIKNNVFQNSQGDDVQGGSNITFTYNLRYHTNPQKQNWIVSTSVNATNLKGNPGFNATGRRWGTYYKAASGTSTIVDRGTDVGLPYVGSAPDIGRWEYAAPSSRTVQVSPHLELPQVTLFPNPTDGRLVVSSSKDISEVKVVNPSGKVVFRQKVDYRRSMVVELPNQRAGVYSVVIMHDKGVETQKLIVTDY